MKFYSPWNATSPSLDIKGDSYPIPVEITPRQKVVETVDGTLHVYSLDTEEKLEEITFKLLTKTERDNLLSFLQNTVQWGKNEFGIVRENESSIRKRVRFIGALQERMTTYQKYEIRFRVRVIEETSNPPPP